MFFPFKPLKGNFLKCTPSGWRHQPPVFQIHTPLHIQLCPMALGTARGEPLRKSAIRKFLQCAVNPSEAESFFHNIDVWQYARRGSLASGHNNPALLLLGVILLQPSSELRPV